MPQIRSSQAIYGKSLLLKPEQEALRFGTAEIRSPVLEPEIRSPVLEPEIRSPILEPEIRSRLAGAAKNGCMGSAAQKQWTTNIILARINFSPLNSLNPLCSLSPRSSLNPMLAILKIICANILMYSAHLPFRASAPTRHDQRLNEQPKDPRKEASHTREGIPAMPRTKPGGGNQVGNQPMRRQLRRQDYSNLKTAGTRTEIPDHSCPPLLPLQHPHPLPTPPCHRVLGDQ